MEFASKIFFLWARAPALEIEHFRKPLSDSLLLYCSFLVCLGTTYYSNSFAVKLLKLAEGFQQNGNNQKRLHAAAFRLANLNASVRH